MHFHCTYMYIGIETMYWPAFRYTPCMLINLFFLILWLHVFDLFYDTGRDNPLGKLWAQPFKLNTTQISHIGSAGSNTLICVLRDKDPPSTAIAR